MKEKSLERSADSLSDFCCSFNVGRFNVHMLQVKGKMGEKKEKKKKKKKNQRKITQGGVKCSGFSEKKNVMMRDLACLAIIGLNRIKKNRNK